MQVLRCWCSLLLPLLVFYASSSCGVRGQRSVNQTTLDTMAASLQVGWTVVTNTREVVRLDARLTLTNAGTESVDYGDWRLYWYSVYPVEPDHLPRPGTTMEVAGQGLTLTAVNGMLLSLAPTASFRPIPPGHTRVIRFKVKYWSVGRSDMFPNWYLTGSASTTPRVVSNTAGTDPAFVSRPLLPQQQKRYDFDYYADRTPEERYRRNYVPYAEPETVALRVVPQPWRVELKKATDDVVVRLTSSWKVWDASDGRVLGNEVDFIVEKLSHLGVTTASSPPASHVIQLDIADVTIADDDVMGHLNDTYSLQVDDVTQSVNISGRGPSGVFLGLQTLLSLLEGEGEGEGEEGKQLDSLPVVNVLDAPRFRFRGFYLDIARNFRTREEIERYLHVMATYKLNRFHLHLADDEGWRIEIPGLPELTELGSKRCHDPEEDSCLIPQLGSGPEATYPGSGFLNASDYRSILNTARRLHIEVIPEVDMPGHSRAAIKAMEKRYRTFMAQNNMAEAERYRLIDPDNPSRYITPQFYNDNIINVCRPSVYTFITKIVREMKALHEGVQDLRVFHVGLDELADAWTNSSMCQQLQQTDSTANSSLMLYFFKKVSGITSREGLNLAAWEDGLMMNENEPFDRSAANNTEVYANVWNNVWEWGGAARAHNLANKGYKVVMSQGTSLYFDHPYEPAWEERGYYWATRFTDTQKVFSFLPMDYYSNILERTSGQPLTKAEVCGDHDQHCPALQQPQNIVGMQGHLWGETVRTRDQADSQIFPRLLALAERSWHYAAWEKTHNLTRRHQLMTDDWHSFARAVGHRELPRLDRMGIRYRVPPPGAVVERQKLMVTGGYPGLVVEYTEGWGDGYSWKEADGTQRLGSRDRLWLRTRSADGQRYSRTVELAGRPDVPATPQPVLDYMGQYLNVRFEISDNYLQYGTTRYVARLFLNNTGDQAIPAGNWELHFPSVQWLEPEMLKEEREFILQDHKMALFHVQGYLFGLSPLEDFPPFEPGTEMEIVFRGEYWSVSRYEQFPNYFVTAQGANARVVNNTVGESLSFVNDFAKVNQWKRDSTDRFDPLTPSARYGKQADVEDIGWAPLPYLPTPLTFQADPSQTMSLRSVWTVDAPPEWSDLADYLKETAAGNGAQGNSLERVHLVRSSSGVPQSPWPGAYSLNINPANRSITITANDSTGALYGIQSLINMAMQSEDGATVFELRASDKPRLPVRGLYLDVARNFHGVSTVLRMLEVMGIYKLNRLHLHLADDEGWRLDIPGLPELTTVGSRRCHDPTEEFCLTPVLGSGPDPNNPGTGFFTIEEYRSILRYAARRHIEVVPEFDMPGHSRAAIKAMALRRKLLLEAGDPDGAHEFALDELGDPSLYISVQLFNDDAVNPCQNSTYRFIRHVMQEVKTMHEGTGNPLKVYHFGGDEVAHGAFVGSNACSEHVRNGDDFKHLFSTRVGKVAADLGLDLGCWEDGVIDLGNPIPRQDMAPERVYANTWQNVWEWGAASRAYYLANEGYQVIMGPATHVYFDMPYEPDPDERGLYWATRFTDTRKAFGFQPQDLWSNVDITRMGDPITLQEVCGDDDKGCPRLEKPENVVGLQGHLWSETVRTSEQVDYMLFPRMLAVAERAWHRSSWEGQDDTVAQRRDWTQFANTLGYGQLRVLDRLHVAYRLCPPGVSQEVDHLKVNTEFPGLKTQYMTSSSDGWQDVTNSKIPVNSNQRVHVRTVSPGGGRYSKTVSVVGTVQSPAPSSQAVVSAAWSSSLMVIALVTLVTLLHRL